jgi:ABC-2 type transport system ATP-binding protein
MRAGPLVRIHEGGNEMIEVENLTKRYGRTTAVDGVSFRVQKGEILGFLGPNGAGKTTTMRILTCYLPPTEGTARVAGYDVFEAPLEVKKRVGYIPETPPLYPDMSVDDFLDFCAKIKGLPAAARKGKIDEAVGKTRIGDVRGKLIGRLSKGYRQRVGLAQAILANPDVLILDEPTAGLDPKQIIETRELIKGLGGDHTIILSTHILPEVQAICNRVQIIHRGRLVFSDSIAGLEQQLKATSLIAAFHATPDMGALAQVPGVSRAEPLPGHRVRIHFTDTDPSETLIAQAVAGGWRLHELSPERRTLEQIFIELTCSEQPADQPQEAA